MKIVYITHRLPGSRPACHQRDEATGWFQAPLNLQVKLFNLLVTSCAFCPHFVHDPSSLARYGCGATLHHPSLAKFVLQRDHLTQDSRLLYISARQVQYTNR